MQFIDSATVHRELSFEHLIKRLQKGLARDFAMPKRQILELTKDSENKDAFALLPAWNEEVIGVKSFTYFPGNRRKANLNTLYSTIVLYKRETGEPLCILDGTSITYWRTAAVSALASKQLSRPDSKHLILFGSGNLASYLVKAHLSVRPINKVTIAARNFNATQKLIDELSNEFKHVDFNYCEISSLQVSQADIIVCATASKTPLFDGSHVAEGTHVDCLGNHLADCRECDSELVKRANVYVDSLVNCLSEAGELIIPLDQGIIKQEHILGELKDLCSLKATKNRNDSDITLFKSVGTAISDLIAAQTVYQSFVKKQ